MINKIKFTFFFVSIFFVFDIGIVHAKKIKAYFNYAAFKSNENKSYIETYMSIVGKSVEFRKNQNNKFQASVNINVAFLINNQIRFAQKYNLKSPEVKDTLSSLPVFIDMQRIELGDTGTYTMEMEITDIHTQNLTPVKFTQNIYIGLSKDSLDFSDIELIESYSKTNSPNILSKAGYDMVPYISSFYHDEMNQLSFYAELYNSKKIFKEKDVFLITCSVESYETGLKLMNYSRFFRHTPQDIVSVFAEFPIQDLPTGNYYLVIEAKDKSNKTLCVQKEFFQRKNTKIIQQQEDLSSVSVSKTFIEKYTQRDSLAEFIKCLRPIASVTEQNFIDQMAYKADVVTKQRFIFNFWQKRDQLYPEKAFSEYMENVKFVNENYSAQNLKGYQTERGRVYLKYGKPDQLTKFDFEPNNYPYEIWQYYKLQKRNNRKFVFYNPTIVGNNFELLHSDALGEFYDPRWQIKLNKRNNRITNLDENTSPDTYGNRASDFFENPR